jgi:hypothetical protein
VSPGPRSFAGLVAAAGVSLVLVTTSTAQELEPRAYAPNPTDVNFLALAYSRTTGDVVFDASLPFSDVTARVNGATLLYGHTFGLAGRAASATALFPYAWGSVQGNVGEDYKRITRSGMTDLRARLAVNLVGGPALSPREFAAHKPGTTLGASLTVVAPSGQYDPSKLINLGTNRWAFKPELGLSCPIGRWFLEAYLGGWLFTENDNFYGGVGRSQAPIATFQLHVVRVVGRRAWIAGDATFYSGGRTTIDGRANDDSQRNSRSGLTLAVPIGKSNSFKVSWASGVTTRVGGDFQILAVAWQVRWFGNP